MGNPTAFQKDNTSFEDFLKQNPTVTEYRLVIKNSTNGKVDFYIQPFNKNGNSLDFQVKSNTIKCITKRAIN